MEARGHPKVLVFVLTGYSGHEMGYFLASVLKYFRRLEDTELRNFF